MNKDETATFKKKFGTVGLITVMFALGLANVFFYAINYTSKSPPMSLRGAAYAGAFYVLLALPGIALALAYNTKSKKTWIVGGILTLIVGGLLAVLAYGMMLKNGLIMNVISAAVTLAILIIEERKRNWLIFSLLGILVLALLVGAAYR